MNFIKNLVLICLLLVLIPLVTCMGVCGKAAVDVSDAIDEHQEVRHEEALEVVTTTSVVETTASAIELAYDENQVAADNRFKGKVIRVTGTIESIGKNQFDDSPYVMLRSRKRFMGVRCNFSEDKNASLTLLKKGQKVVLKGRGMGPLSLGDCVVDRN